jgi:hypothetical protein
MISQFHLSLTQVLIYTGVWIVLDAIKAVCGHEVDWKPVSLLAFFSAGLLLLGFFTLWKTYLP